MDWAGRAAAEPIWRCSRAAVELLDLLLARGLTVRLQVRGGSMGGQLRHGDHVWVRRQVPEDLALGEVVVARRPPGYICHRLVGAARDVDGRLACLWLRGDARGQRVQQVLPADILGVVVRRERRPWWVGGRHRWRRSRRMLAGLHRVLGLIYESVHGGRF